MQPQILSRRDDDMRASRPVRSTYHCATVIKQVAPEGLKVDQANHR